MTNIPKARKLLDEMLKWELEDHVELQIKEALSLMTRSVSPRRTNPNRVTMTASIGEEARRLHRNTRMTQAEIGERLGVDGGRVSEAIKGMWR